jgi:hypothetical protein
VTAMGFNEVTEKFHDDVRWLHGRWINIKHHFECKSKYTLTADMSLEIASRQLGELKDKIDAVIAMRQSSIRSAA